MIYRWFSFEKDNYFAVHLFIIQALFFWRLELFCNMKYSLIALATFAVMKGITWLTHRYVMHGFLCYLHKGSRRENSGFFKKHNTILIIFAIPGWLCIMPGSMNHAYWAVSIGAGIALYGLAYLTVDGIIIHQRFKLVDQCYNRYIKGFCLIHMMHHRHLGKEERENFGMLLPAKK